ncbi:hypothetical protein HHK36_001904 [Tetracentron sinense]|uniref:Wings apart-like protein C-terminal domain-containing protein n=1 Tax=Tetracentron sinense TaxID=13715 RepID=A0A835DRI7_TETSI|nr:hypothetical protein HHK36_001904 [Tetracentron sinense]
MIVRTYARRNRCISRSYSESSFNGNVDDSFRESISQESSQEIHSVPFSSQESSPWSFDSELYGSNSSQGSLSVLPPRVPVGDLSLQGNGGVRKSKKPRNIKRESGVHKQQKSLISKGVRSLSMPATSTLMEAQEFGEMMEHVDEVNFALDGLRKGQQSRIRRASLLSLLSFCATAQQRRLLRTQGMAKTIVHAIMGLSFDDSPSNLAAAALFYVLASDDIVCLNGAVLFEFLSLIVLRSLELDPAHSSTTGQDEHHLDSPSCIRFLLKLLKPSMSDTTEDKALTIGCKLLALRKDPSILRDTTKKLDSSSAAIISKVQEILASCKEMKSRNGDVDGIGRPELSPKWIALLTMEKACLSTVSLEGGSTALRAGCIDSDTSGTVRKVGGNFKEKLRELGGLDAVFEVAGNCHSIIEESKNDLDPHCLALLLKCLKIMENATFLSKDNQNHLLGMDGDLHCKGSPLPFTRLIISAIKLLSGLSLLQSSSSLSNDEKPHCISDRMSCASEILLKEDHKAVTAFQVDKTSTFVSEVEWDRILSSNSSKRCCSTEKVSSRESSKVSQKRKWLSTSKSGYSVSSSETTSALAAGICSVKMRDNSSTSAPCNGISRSSNGGIANTSGLKINPSRNPTVTEDVMHGLLEDSQDPFAFDEDDFKPSTWDLLSRTQKVSRTQKSRVSVRELEDGCQPQLISSQQESSNGKIHESCEISCSSAIEEENSNLLTDCLLTAVKVLMNLTNDNLVGCQQIAACGGLETMSSLIICHFPSFSSCSSPLSQIKEDNLTSKSSINLHHQSDRHLTDQELDFLVAILGLLVNLVEKDSQNRSRLAAASISLPSSGGSEGEESRRDVIPLLCSIFLANQGAGEAAGEGRDLPWVSNMSDEAAVLQGEREAEKMIIESYAALVLAFLSTESKNVREAIACCLLDHNLEVLIPVLERFVVGISSDIKHDLTGNP